MRTNLRQRRPLPVRHAFSLIELLVVISIMVLLATILTMTVRGTLSGAKRAATIATLQKLHNNFRERSAAVTNHIQSLESQFDKYVVDSGYFRQAGFHASRARVLAVKDMYRKSFPQRWSEVGIASTNPLSGAESAELLYYSATGEPVPDSGTPARVIEVPGYTPVGRDAFLTTEYADTDGDGRLEMVDGWGKPLRFYRWPTRLIRPINPAYVGAAAFLIRTLPSDDDLNRDPDDPRAVMVVTKTNRWDGAKTIETFSGPDGSPGVKGKDDDGLNGSDDAGEVMWISDDWYSYHVAGTYHTPLIVSGGEDNIHGLGEPADPSAPIYGFWGGVADLNAITDDISNLNATAGRN